MNLFAPAEIAANYAEAGVKKSSLPVSKMLLLGVLAGMLIAFPSCVTNMVSYGLDNNSTIRAISGLLFAFGLGMVILIGAELFTGNTLIFISVLEKKVRVTAMLKDWLFVYIGNFIGSLLVAVLCAKFGWLSASGNALAVYAMKVALGKMTMPFQNAFFMGFLQRAGDHRRAAEPGRQGYHGPVYRRVGPGDVLRHLRLQPLHCRHDLLHHGPVRQDRTRLRGVCCGVRPESGRPDLGHLLHREYDPCDAGQHSGRPVRGLHHVVRLPAEGEVKIK